MVQELRGLAQEMQATDRKFAHFCRAGVKVADEAAPDHGFYFQLSSGTGRKLPLNGKNNLENTNRHILPLFAHKKNMAILLWESPMEM